MRLRGAVAIVTGGGRGIGRSVCLAFAREGARVVAAARTRGQIETVAREIESAGGVALAVPVDVADEQSVNELVARTLGEYGRIDVLVNNAAINHAPRRVVEMDTETWDRVIGVNLRGAFLCSRAVLSVMIRQRSGKITSRRSVAGAGRAGGARTGSRRRGC